MRPEGELADIMTARERFPATRRQAYFNTAAVGLASRELTLSLSDHLNTWSESGLDYVRGEAAAEAARTSVASLLGADRDDVALIPSVSAAAGLVASQFRRATSGQNIVIGDREYSSNHFPWRLLARKGYEIRQVPFRAGGLTPDEVARQVDARTTLVAFSGVQTATGHRTDLPAISEIAHAVGALVFVDGAQLVGALPVSDHLDLVDVLATPDHKFLMHAGRGMGYCYLSPDTQDRFTPTSAGWRAGAVPFDSFFGPEMQLSPTASRFDASISWTAAIGNEAALSVFDDFGQDAIYRRNADLAGQLRHALTDVGWVPAPLAPANRSTIVAVPVGDADPAVLVGRLKDHGVVSSARDGNLRLAVHFYNHEDDIHRLAAALPSR